MKALETINVLSDISASQRGMFTSAQAVNLGVERMTISRLLKHNQISQVVRGVYRFNTAPIFREEDIYATWLSFEPKIPSFDREDSCNHFVASCNTAAWLLNLGELEPEPMVFSHYKRRQTRKNIRFIKRDLTVSDVEIVAGIPTTTPRITIVDLLQAGEDLSLVSSVLRDAEVNGKVDGIEEDINALSQECGFGKAFDLYEYLKGLA